MRNVTFVKFWKFFWYFTTWTSAVNTSDLEAGTIKKQDWGFVRVTKTQTNTSKHKIFPAYCHTNKITIPHEYPTNTVTR